MTKTKVNMPKGPKPAFVKGVTLPDGIQLSVRSKGRWQKLRQSQPKTLKS